MHLNNSLSKMMLTLYKDEEEAMNGLWAGYIQILNKYLPDLFGKWLTPQDVTLHALHVGKMWVESLYGHKEFTSEQRLRVRERIVIKVAFTKSSEIPLLSNVGLKLNIQKTKIMASGPITSWQTGGETMETVTDFILGGSKITADSDCNHETKRRLLLGRNFMINLDSILKSRDITLPT